MKKIVNIARIITGALFIFSGLVKAIDPKGLAYKMEEFFEVFAQLGWMPKMMMQLYHFSLPFSIVMITLEVMVGAALLVGWQKKLSSWLLLLLMLLFTFLTAFVLFSGKIRACGCFGDCIPLTPIQTFTKDIILLGFTLLIMFNLKYIQPVSTNKICWAIVFLSTVATIILQWYVLNHLPIVDCLPFKKGSNIIKARQMPEGAVPDKYDYRFIYKKGNEEKEFGMAELPDSTWAYVDRKQILIQKGKNNIPLINDFTLTNEDGNDVTSEILNQNGIYYLIYMNDIDPLTGKMKDYLKYFFTASRIEKIYIVTSQKSRVEKMMQQAGIPITDVLTCDAVAIKTAARTNPTVYRMNGPVVEQKWGRADIGKIP